MQPKDALITFIGDRLGLFKAMAGLGGLTSDELAKKDWTHPKEQLNNGLAAQAAGGYVTYDSTTMVPILFLKNKLWLSLTRTAQHMWPVFTNH